MQNDKKIEEMYKEDYNEIGISFESYKDMIRQTNILLGVIFTATVLAMIIILLMI